MNFVTLLVIYHILYNFYFICQFQPNLFTAYVIIYNKFFTVLKKILSFWYASLLLLLLPL